MKGAALALIVVSMVRIASTWTVFSATVDEPMHVSAALQLYTQRAYTYQPENPPLPRLVIGLAPWIGGMDFDPRREVNEQLLRVFYSDDRYKTNLVLARTGNLLFFVLGSAAVWFWACRMLGDRGGFIALLLFTFQPMIAGHAGLATHDMAAAAGTALSLFAFVRWMDEQTLRRAAVFGLAYGLAILCKFSCIGYVPAACLAMYVIRRDFRWRAIGPSFLSACAASALVVWGGYAFSVQPFVAGVRGVMAVDRSNAYFMYLLGDTRTNGWLHYFPVAVAVKSTIASLVLAFIGGAASGVERHGGRSGRRSTGLEALAAALAILAVSMTSQINLGVRHLLPLYAPLAVAGAAGALAFRRKWMAIALLAWHTGASALAHPDAFPYFNEAAGRKPWKVLLDSNIDWGQDALRLKYALRERKAGRVGLAVMGWHDWDALGYPPHYPLHRDVPAQGWVAVSEHLYGVARGAPWLEGRKYERIGKSIRLYYLE